MASISQDTRNAGTFTGDNRQSAASITQDSRATSGNLWSSTIYPWTLDFPWQWTGSGQILNLDDRS